MARIALVTGGCRSGKSAFAQHTAERISPSRLYVATCPVIDDEMWRRIEAHRQARHDRHWDTVEESVDLLGVFRDRPGYGVVLVDCVTLWINNLMYSAESERHVIDEAEMTTMCQAMLDAAAQHPGTVIFVTNEVGLGIVPENAQVRHYRDLVGRANQAIAGRAENVTLLCCGIPLTLKGPGEL
jgi:adenosylcobinamide kinase/adenosylcobinamide-phosphate guanylyltransferase